MSLAHQCFWIAGGAAAVFFVMLFCFFGSEIIKGLIGGVTRLYRRIAVSWPVRFCAYRSGHGCHAAMKERRDHGIRTSLVAQFHE